MLSPREESHEKLALYFSHRAREVWVVNPRKKTMSAYVSRDGSVLFQQVTDEFRPEAAGRLVIRLGDIFGYPGYRLIRKSPGIAQIAWISKGDGFPQADRIKERSRSEALLQSSRNPRRGGGDSFHR